METEFDQNLIFSSNGDVLGRKNLVKKITNSSVSETANLTNLPAKNKEIKKNVLSQFDLNKNVSFKLNITENDEKKQKALEIPENINITNKSKPNQENISQSSNFLNNASISFDKGQHNRNSFIFLAKSHKIDHANKLSTIDVGDSHYKILLNGGSSSFISNSESDIKNEQKFEKKRNENFNPSHAATDFGYWDYKKIPEIYSGSYYLNHIEKERSLQLPDLHSYEYDNTKINGKFSKTWKQWNTDLIDNSTDSNSKFNDNNQALSRNSSICSFNKILPVGKFATQKFHVVQDEEELINCPEIYETDGTIVSNLESTNEFESIIECVTIDICNWNNVEINTNIEANKYTRKNELEKPWTKQRTEITRLIKLDLCASGKLEKVKIFIGEVQRDTKLVYNARSSYRLKSTKFQLSGIAAFKVYNMLMNLAEDSPTNSCIVSNKIKNPFTPHYLFATLQNASSL